MKQKILIGILSAEALVCVLFVSLQTSLDGVFTTVIAFPFEQIGSGLRFLSLSGEPGNIVAIVLYTAICLLPVAVLAILWKRRKLCAEDGLLVLLSVLLFAVLYIMINPGSLRMSTDGVAGRTIVKAIYGSIVYSIICGYIVLRVLRLFLTGKADKSIHYISVMLCLLNMLFVYMIFGAGFKSMLDLFAALRSGNIGNEHLPGPSYIFLVLQFAVDALPHALSIFIVFSSLRLLNEIKKDRFSAETIDVAKRTARLCTIALVAVTLANIVFDVLPLIFIETLLVITVSVQIPILSIIFVMVALLLTRLIAENKQLKDDNDMFI